MWGTENDALFIWSRAGYGEFQRPSDHRWIELLATRY